MNRDRELWFKWFKIGVLMGLIEDIHENNIKDKFEEIYYPAIKNEKSLDDVIEDLKKELK